MLSFFVLIAFAFVWEAIIGKPTIYLLTQKYLQESVPILQVLSICINIQTLASVTQFSYLGIGASPVPQVLYIIRRELYHTANNLRLQNYKQIFKLTKKMKAPKIIRLLAYHLFRGWYCEQMQKALEYSNAKRAERMDSWLNAQCYNYALTLGSRGSDFSFLFDENIGHI